MNEFNPDWVSPPGDTIKECLKDKKISNRKLANLLNIPSRLIDGLISGDMKITPDLAENLARILGGTKEFWINREVQYREGLRLKEKDI